LSPARETPTGCPLCGGELLKLPAAQPGFRRGLSFDVLCCAACDTSLVHPMEVDPSIYDAIYAHRDEVPGYDRYGRYARAVLEEADPLDFLARSEDVYWAIRSCVERRGSGGRILDVGSGLGYLTYALRRAGHDATGMDVSKVAVEAATARYGAHYREADLADWSVRRAGEFDLVVMAELVEHVPDPVGFLAMAAKLLAPRGELVVTTPNRSYFPRSMTWETDAPPVHLWWFSEASMRALAARTGLGIDFVDFAPLNRTCPAQDIRIVRPGLPSFGAALDEENRPLSREVLRREERERRPPFYRVRRWGSSWARRLRSLGVKLGVTPPGARRGVLCAVMSRKDAREA